MKKIIYFSCLALVIFAGCNKKEDIVMQVGNDKMTVKMLEKRFQEAPATLQSYLNTEAGRKQFMDLLVRERTMIESARQAKYDKRTDYKEAIDNFSKEQERRLEEYKESLLVELYVKDLHAKEFAPSEADIEKYYKEHENDYKKPLEVVASHILLPSNEAAEKVLARINAGENFAKLAKEVSIDPISANRGGEIGPFKKGDLIPEFEKVVFPLGIGKISGIVETQFGFHIIKKISQKTLPSRTLEDTKEEIKRLLEKSKFDAWLEVAKENNKVTINYDALSKISTASSMPADEQLETKETGAEEAGMDTNTEK